MRPERAAQVILGSAAWLWIAAVVFAPWLVLPIGHFVCHQRPDRSFFFHGHQLAVCARCTGLYLGAALGAPVAVLWAAPGAGRSARWTLGLAAIPTAMTWTLEFAGLVPFSNLTRFAAALPLGAAAAWLVLAELAPWSARPRPDAAHLGPSSSHLAPPSS